MNDFASILHDSPPAEASRPVLVPGEIELNNLARHQRDGLALDPAVLALLDEHAAKVSEGNRRPGQRPSI